MKIIRHHFETIDSTNIWSKEHADIFDERCLTLVTASQQTSGKGRLGRSWISPAGKNIYVTFNFFIDSKRKDIGNLPQLLAIAAAEVIDENGFSTQLKWPNDLLLHNKKVGGILTETKLINDMLFVAMGIGININMLSDEANTIDKPATSLFIESGRQHDVDAMIGKLSENFEAKLEEFLEDGFTPFLYSYKDRLTHSLQTKMTFRDSQKTWQGHFAGINSDGTLSMQLSDGTLRTFVAGEVVTNVARHSDAE